MKKVNTPTERIAICFEHARATAIAVAFGCRAVLPTVDATADQLGTGCSTASSHPAIVSEAMVIACAGRLVMLNQLDRGHRDADDVLAGAWQLLGRHADESEAVAEAEIALRRARRLVSQYHYHIDRIADLLIHFDELLESLSRSLQQIEAIDEWPKPPTNKRPKTVDAIWTDRLPKHVQPAIHEAGHAVAFSFFGHIVEEITVDKTDGEGGHVRAMTQRRGVDVARERLVALMAGVIASERACPYLQPGAEIDEKMAHAEASRLFGPACRTSEKIHNELQSAEQRAAKVVYTFWSSVIKVAEMLLKYQWTAQQIPKFSESLESLDEKAFTPIIPFQSGETTNEFIASIQEQA